MSDQSAKLTALMSYRAKLEARLEIECEAESQQLLELTQLLLRQCDFLIEKACKEGAVADLKCDVAEESN